MTKRGLSRGSRPVVPDDFGFDDGATRPRPGAGLIGRLAIGGGGVVSGGDDGPERRDERLGVAREDGLAIHGDDVFDPGGLQVVKDVRGGEAGIEADAEPGPGKGAPEFREQALQQADRARRPRRVAGAEDRGDEVVRTSSSKVRLPTSGR